MQLLPYCADVTEALPLISYRLPVLFRDPGSVTGNCRAFFSSSSDLYTYLSKPYFIIQGGVKVM